MTIPQQKRRPRFKRIAAPNFRLQERDCQIIRQVYQHRFLSSEQIIALHSNGSAQKIRRRLNLLFHAGYLDRPRQQTALESNQPMIYALANKGARFLEQKNQIPKSQTDWTTNNRRVKAPHIEHALLTANFLVCLELATRQNPDIKLVKPQEIKQNWLERKRGKGKPRWRVKVVHQENGQTCQRTLGLDPDSIFGLHFPRKQKTAYFFLETDCGTMPNKRHNFSKNFFRSSIYRKLIGYSQSQKQGLFEREFGFKNARVLVLTPTPQRIGNIIKLGQELDERKKGLRLFYFALSSGFSLKNPSAVLQSIWTNGRGEKANLID